MFLKFEEYVSLNMMKTVIKLQKNSEIIFGRKNLTRRDDRSRRAGCMSKKIRIIPMTSFGKPISTAKTSK